MKTLPRETHPPGCDRSWLRETLAGIVVSDELPPDEFPGGLTASEWMPPENDDEDKDQ